MERYERMSHSLNIRLIDIVDKYYSRPEVRGILYACEIFPALLGRTPR
jgi:hypothetical protein